MNKHGKQIGRMTAMQHVYEREQAKKEFATWMTDEQISELIGDEWQTEMDVSSEMYKYVSNGHELMLEDANRWLAENNKNIRVVDVRNDPSGDFLDWMVEKL